MIDWITQSKSIYKVQLPKGFSIYIVVAVHQSGKISIRLNCSMLIGTLNFKKGLQLDNKRTGGKILKKMSDLLRTKSYI